jgi:hypothetical protein
MISPTTDTTTRLQRRALANYRYHRIALASSTADRECGGTDEWIIDDCQQAEQECRRHGCSDSEIARAGEVVN